MPQYPPPVPKSPNSVSISLHTDSIGFKSGDRAGHSRVSIPFNAL